MLLTTLSKTPLSFPTLPPAPMLLLSYLLESYAYIQHRFLSAFLPPLSKDLNQLQPALFAVSDVHAFADDSRARLEPRLGGLGYSPPITTLHGMCKQLVDWNRRAEVRGVEVSMKKGALSVSQEGVDVNFVAPENKL